MSIIDIIKAGDMSANITSPWFAMPSEGRVAITAHWSGVTGTIDGTLSLQVSNDPTDSNSWVQASSQAIAGANNDGNVHMWDLNYRVGYVRVVYTKGNISAGTLNVKGSF